ncbi:MAG: energy transducer TonB [Bacteroidaceae bacterium]|nr:energy transducer TonB [Bacteroidaceae bacterium]
MKKISFALIAIFLATASYALTKSNDELMCYEPTPQFPGGDKACLEFVRRNIRYSDEMIKNGIKGRVVVGFKVEKDGSLSNLRIKKSADARLNDEALRVVRSMPKWKPALEDGKPVEMEYVLPVMFELNDPSFYERDSVYLMPEERAMFPGGDAACQEWLRDNVRYPADCQRQKVEGRVLVTFVVRYNGIITDATVISNVDYRLMDEAFRVVEIMPKWIPAKDKGQPVSMRYTIPIQFSLKKN